MQNNGKVWIKTFSILYLIQCILHHLMIFHSYEILGMCYRKVGTNFTRKNLMFCKNKPKRINKGFTYDKN